jgi:superkiller protein 3
MRHKKSFLFILITMFYFSPVFFAGKNFTVAAQNTLQADNTGKLFFEGCELIRQKKYTEAAKVFEKIIEADPTKRGAHTNLSWMYLELGRYEDAANTAQKEIALYPKSSMAHNNLGFALTRLGKFEEAILELQKAVALDVHNTKAHINLGYAFSSLKRYEEAVSALEFLTESNPDYAQGYDSLANAAMMSGQKE